jgi:hypothetical protein
MFACQSSDRDESARLAAIIGDTRMEIMIADLRRPLAGPWDVCGLKSVFDPKRTSAGRVGGGVKITPPEPPAG